MRYNKLGRTGLFVSELCLGTMTFGGTGEVWSKIGGLQQGEAEGLVRTAVDKGINFIDTADVYSSGLAEEITGQALKNLGLAAARRRDSRPRPSARWGRGRTRGAPRACHLLEACKASLKRLQTDYIDLYQIHGFDDATPIEETLRALDTSCSTATSATSASRTGQRGRSPRRWEFRSASTSRGSRRCRPTTRLPAATSNASSCR